VSVSTLASDASLRHPRTLRGKSKRGGKKIGGPVGPPYALPLESGLSAVTPAHPGIRDSRPMELHAECHEVMGTSAKRNSIAGKDLAC